MNKFGFALTFVAAMVGLAVASEIGEFSHPGLHRGGFGGQFNGLENYEESILVDELRGRGYPIGPFRGGLGVGGLRGPGRLGRRGGFGGVGRSGLGVGAIGGVGGAGFRDSQSSLGALNAGNHGFESGLAEKSQAGLLAGQKQFDAGQHFNTRNDNEGVHKHQLINSDKTIIKDKTTGVNDFDSFSNSNGVNQGSRLDASESGVAAGIKSGRVQGERERDNQLSAVGAEQRDTAAGAAGAVGGVGAAL